MSAEPSGRRLAFSTVLGVVAGLALWSAGDGSEPAALRAEQGSPGAGRAPVPGSASSFGGDPARPRPRDHRPPHTPPVPATPPRLEIPAIGVRAHVSPLGRTASGALGVPGNWSVVGRWIGGSKPGSPGVSVLVGHVDSQSRPAVFHRLGKLRRGDLIRYVGRDAPVARFVVLRKERAPKHAFPTARVYGETEEASLRLVTCGGSFDWSRGHYRDNLIVYAAAL